jgi:hypothetical protein
VHRRSLLRFLAFGLPAAALLGGCDQRDAVNHPWPSLAAAVTGLPAEPRAAVGTLALGQRTRSEWFEVLAALPDIRWSDDGAISALDLDTVAARLRTTSSRQFAADAVIELDGWILSELDCALCALAVPG